MESKRKRIRHKKIVIKNLKFLKDVQTEVRQQVRREEDQL